MKDAILTKPVKVLGIETSCDDTSMCLLSADMDAPEQQPEILAFKSFNQDTVLREWGGVVPEIAARNHMMKLGPLMEEIFEMASLSPSDIDMIGVTTHPGLLGPLLTGLNGAKSLSLLFKLPIVPVNHLYAHLEAIHLTKNIEYPYLGLLVSGGHSMYLLAHSATEFELLGTTIDDAAGEAYDKGGKLLKLGYPAGMIIDNLAKEGDPKAHKFPIGMQSSKDAMLSFSGVKTSLRLFVEKNGMPTEEQMPDVCASYQHAIVSALELKLRYALESAKEKLGRPVDNIVVGGGVACNSYLRKVLNEKYDHVHFVEPRFCTDNGAMIANYTLRSFKDNQIPFPECLSLDARSRFISKNNELQKARAKGNK